MKWNLQQASFLFSFSLLSIAALIFSYSDGQLTRALFVCVIFAFFGFCVITYFEPAFFYSNYQLLFNDILFIHNADKANLILFVMHTFPVIMFWNRLQISLQDAPNVLVLLMGYMFLYTLVVLGGIRIYPWSWSVMVGLIAFLYLGLMLWLFLFSRK